MPRWLPTTAWPNIMTRVARFAPFQLRYGWLFSRFGLANNSCANLIGSFPHPAIFHFERSPLQIIRSLLRVLHEFLSALAHLLADLPCLFLLALLSFFRRQTWIFATLYTFYKVWKSKAKKQLFFILFGNCMPSKHFFFVVLQFSRCEGQENKYVSCGFKL